MFSTHFGHQNIGRMLLNSYGTKRVREAAIDCKTAAPEYLNLSFREFPSEIHQLPAWEIGLKVTGYAIAEIVALIGNLLVIWTVIRCKKMRTITNFYIVNLSVFDLLIPLLPMWVSCVEAVTNGWVLGPVMCKFNVSVMVLALCGSVFTMTAIAADRLFAVLFPQKFRSSKTRRRNFTISIVTVWFLAIIMALPPLWVYKYTEIEWKDYRDTYCRDVWPAWDVHLYEDCTEARAVPRKTYWGVLLIALNWFPSVFMTVAYAIVGYKFWSSRRVQPSGGALARSTLQYKSRKRVLAMLLTMLLVYLMCWSPFQTCIIYLYFGKEHEAELPENFMETFYFVAVFLANVNSALNPLLYAGLNVNFRRGFVEVFSCLINRKPRVKAAIQHIEVGVTKKNRHQNDGQDREATRSTTAC